MTMTAPTATRRVATYERVSSEDQRERETIRTQTDSLERRLAGEDGIEVVARYTDDGVSGMKAMAERPGGGRLLHDAAARHFDELWVYRTDRLGRNLSDMAATGRQLERLGIAIMSVVEGRLEPFMFDLMAVLAQNEHRTFRRRTADGINRVARAGGYPGGVVAYGYRLEGEKPARPVPDETVVWGTLSAADIVRRIYRALAFEGRSCRSIAAEFNALGVPTHQALYPRGVRGEHTQRLWRPGRIRNMVVNPVYKGVLRYGLRTTPDTEGRELITAPIERLVSEEVWEAAQQTLAANRVMARNVRHQYLLRGVVRCGSCGLSYCGSQGRVGVGWYRCNGQMVERGPVVGRCHNPSVRLDQIEPVVWADIEAFLRDPGDILAELEAATERETQAAVIEADSITLTRALQALEAQRRQALALNIRGRLGDAELDSELDRIASEREEIERRLADLRPPDDPFPSPETVDLLAEVRGRLDAGLTFEKRQEIVRLLVHVVVRADGRPDGKRTTRVVVDYRFPGVAAARTATGSWRRGAGSVPGSAPRAPRGQSRRCHLRAAGGAPQARRDRTPPARRGTTRRGGRASPRRAPGKVRRRPWQRTTGCDAGRGTVAPAAVPRPGQAGPRRWPRWSPRVPRGHRAAGGGSVRSGRGASCRHRAAR